ncbi:MAG: pyruvate dehydrogenase (acetyl-transferring) E1 component subunit alpha [Rhodospirillales bacterium]|jgi:pyruvate dehydrogenase E1 component alpha subunit|nr:pyruvate dehydrogenase (acetyl-transferring) E1 component subunit alpha [Rhodospirillaceae bacterium]MDP6427239.1 pyruvate dehydrogenase (acetyl-transferring) E1 component subunit alpha [Rhodospirillales bacterium]MDP6645435.1 pyruvate dehydrogenase (acetyl-transferring) E1 component subunit alpha [Rhodospirillales bacterium]MDP6841693.1 pyruvate dehydrogenase (acetyl-transferring) E1 component subunit alpha [Rhodospirillales bacterium]
MTAKLTPPLQYIDQDGGVAADLPEFARDSDQVIGLYRHMVRARRFDTKMIALQRTGRIPAYPPTLGQEATHVGLAAAMAPEDMMFPTYREAPAQLVRGVTLDEVILVMGGDERGNVYSGPSHDFPPATPISTQTTHAVGAAYAFKLRDEKRAALATIGDGGTSRGDFYEALNFAGVWHAPVVFVIINNGWAISLPREKQSAAERLSDKGVAAGVPGRQVDGNDVIAVYTAVSDALETARGGGGPALIEALTHRLTDHSTADDASRYRDPELVSAQWKEEPLLRMRAYLTGLDAWSKEDEESLLVEIDAEIDAAVAVFEAGQPQPPEAMFDYMFAELPDDLARQRAEALESLAKEEAHHG